ncbi:hypothetical protein [Methylocystis sp. Sn-Cys]|uniref:hypothetical protein n=1 Tax=Methylocystis sp. Sn-Cys TaxID=1701263 RepID=UPI001920D92E|nr:hypothetical protein [Methylocystis sp. Sn-Cys]MBL1255427.1 hypothetical protein [Methylocystis sp. Sn-Cys]
MRSIHPFPARMAPDTVADYLKKLPHGSRIMDPMCGSGVVLRQSALLGHSVKGFDIDPLAVLMSRVWTRKGRHASVCDIARKLVIRAEKLQNFKHTDLNWVAHCNETTQFIEYWFAEPQRSQLARLTKLISNLSKTEENWICDVLKLALSRIIVTKQAGASLAWDVSHSRPHRVRDENDFDVYAGFLKAANQIVNHLDSETLPRGGHVESGDCRQLDSVKSNSVDFIITSPPYLNAIDYLRGHKLSLVWIGYTIPQLRALRSNSVGTENTRGSRKSIDLENLERSVRSIANLPPRQRAIVHKYAEDAELILCEMSRILCKHGEILLVLGDSNVRGIPVYNSKIFRHVAEGIGFTLTNERKRPLQSNRRYLPITDSSGALARRMRTEVLQTYRFSESA